MTNLDYYLTSGHSARSKTTFIAIAVGAGSGMFSEWLGAPLKLAAVVCILVIGAVEIARAWQYAQPAKRKRIVDADLPSASRRSLILAPVSTFLFIIVEFLPVPKIEAAVMDRRLQKATGGNPPYDKVDKLVTSAIHNEIPASPKSIDAAKHQVAQALTTDVAPAARESATGTLARLEGYKVFSQNLIARKPQSYVNIQNAVAYRTLEPPYPHAWVLGIGATEEVAKATLVYRVRIKDLSQEIDWFKWVDIVFEDSTILYYGGDIYLANVTFKNCKVDVIHFLDPNPDLTKRVVERLQRANDGPPISLIVTNGSLLE
jgi:hypothetical protein